MTSTAKNVLGFILLFVMGAIASPVSAGTLWGTSIQGGNLMMIDATTGAATIVGPLGTNGVTGLAYDANSNILYGVDRNADTLVSIDTSTGTATAIGSLGINTAAGGLTYDVNSNSMYYSDFSSANLYSIDTANGAASLVGALGIGEYNQGLAFDPNTNTLYSTDSSSGSLYTVNTSTGAQTLVGSLGVSFSDHGLAFDSDNNILYLAEANQSPNYLHVVDTSTGAATVVGEIGDNVQGFAYQPDGAVEGASTARFKVTKTFSNGRDEEVEVTLTCNSGLPLTQSFMIAGGDEDGVTFVVTELPEEGATCEVTESGGPDNYMPVMNGGAGCEWAPVRNGLRICEIVNYPDPAEYTVEKDWIVPDQGYEEMNYLVDVVVTCDSDILTVGGSSYSGGSWWSGVLDDGDAVTFEVDTTDDSTACSAEEMITQSGVEGTASAACAGADLDAGNSATCTFTNTVFFEGIPTLNQYGLALMALLMLGVGFVGFRRFA